MKRAMLTLTGLLLLLTAFAAPLQTAAPSEAPGTLPPAAEPPTAPPPRPGPDPGEPAQPGPEPGRPPQGAPSGGPVMPGAPGEPPGGPPAQQPDPPPPITWYIPDIGRPLRSDDPAAAGKKAVLLTFDDGPVDSGTTAQILDTLAAKEVRAIFFITGRALQHRELVERIHREGHLLAPHGLTHANLTALSEAQIRAEIDPLVALIEEVTGSPPRYFRPPFGAYDATVLAVVERYGMELVTWTAGSLDWEGVRNGYKDPQRVVADVMRQLHPGAVLLFHDTMPHTAEALPEVIRRIRAEGYEFVMLP